MMITSGKCGEALWDGRALNGLDADGSGFPRLSDWSAGTVCNAACEDICASVSDRLSSTYLVLSRDAATLSLRT